MKGFRLYGNPPYSIAVIHGGPGAPGDVAPVARKLSQRWGVIEPFQTKNSIDDLVEELNQILSANCSIPIIIIGHSWGAFLSYIFTSKKPEVVKMLILVSSGPFEASYASAIMSTRTNRLTELDNEKLNELTVKISESSIKEKNHLLKAIGVLMSKADDYNPTKTDENNLEFSYEAYENVWREASNLRKTGKLLSMAKAIKQPVIAIHGDYDPHPAEGVKKPLSSMLNNFKFFLLPKCGHNPWKEQYAYSEFFSLLFNEIGSNLESE